MTSGGNVERVQSWPDRIRTVKPEAVHAAAKTYLDKRRSVTGANAVVSNQGLPGPIPPRTSTSDLV